MVTTVNRSGLKWDVFVAPGIPKTARELYDQMLELYPKRVNPGALWMSARAVKP